MSVFGNNQPTTTRVADVRVTQSSQGKCVPVVMGEGRIQQSLIWMDGLVSWQSDGGKGGGKTVAGYVYASDVIAALCNGPASGLGSVWDGQSWLSTNSVNDAISIVSVYSPSNAAMLVADNGVAFEITSSATYNDYGAPAATVLSQTDYAPLVLKPYGTVLTTGQYSINPLSIGTFSVSAAANASGGNTVYTGTFTGGTAPYASGASNAYIGFAFVVSGFSKPQNNGTFVCTASSGGLLTLANANGAYQFGQPGTAVETGNSYHFAAADLGKNAVVNYQLSIQEIRQQETDVIPPTLSIPVGGTFAVTGDLGVLWYSTSGTPGPNDMQPLVSVSGTPTTGQYNFSIQSGGGATYTYAAADVGKEVLETWKFENVSAATNNTPNLLKFEFFGGEKGQAIWPYILSGGASQIGTDDGGQSPREPAFPAAALGYTNTCYLGYGPMSLGLVGELSDITVEVLTPDAYGGGIPDCNPIQCIWQVLTNSVWGLGIGAIPFPASAIDNGPLGTWGGPAGTPGTRSVASTAWNWFSANSFFISPVLDTQDSAASTIGKWLEAGCCAGYMSEGLFKIVPYGTISSAGNGCTWVAPTTAVAALDDTCFRPKEGDDPVQSSRAEWQDGYNTVQVTWSNRAFQYSDELTQEFDQSSINRWGSRVEGAQSLAFVTTLPAAVFAANMRLKRGMNIRNQYVFSLPFTYSYLEPMDLLELTCSSQWASGLNNVNLAMNALSVRIVKVVDDPVTGLELTCEDSLFHAGMPVIYNKGVALGTGIVNAYADPGTAEVVMFEATNRLTAFDGNEIWIGAAGTSADYGSCRVWVSQDATKYVQIGAITAQARMGELAAIFPTGTDPDTVNSLEVQMVTNSGQLEAGATTDADLGTTLCFVDGEIISYSACAITGQNEYTMSGYIRRGQMGSTISAHAIGSLFLRLDSTIFKYTYDPTWAGLTLYFKFQAVNRFGNCAQDLSVLTAVPFVVPGLNPGTVDASSGLVIVAGPGTPARPVGTPARPVTGIGAGPLSWTPIA
jgi:Putative phage tail protein